MSSEHSITTWFTKLKAGRDPEAEEQLFARFVRRVEALARQRLGGIRSFENEEDIALSALKSFLMRAPEGQFTQASDRDSLWALLAAITANKVASLQRRQLAEKRDIRRATSLDEIMKSGPTNEFLDCMVTESNEFLQGLDESLRKIARQRLEGYTKQEIADRVGTSQTTVHRRLETIGRLLQESLNAND